MSINWEQELRAERNQKDEFFSEHPRSPLPADEQTNFDGLEYYPPDTDYRFELPLHEFDDHDTLTVETTADGQQTYIRWGEFRFELSGEEYTLTAYKQSASEDQLWVPFRDERGDDLRCGAVSRPRNGGPNHGWNVGARFQPGVQSILCILGGL